MQPRCTGKEGLGRFNTADPYRASAGAGDPGSWNRYTYVGGDPINYADPRGLDRTDCSNGWINDASSSGPCTSGMVGVDLAGSMCGEMVFALTPACGPYGSGYVGIIIASLSEISLECPLERLSQSNYKRMNDQTHVLFSPEMASRLDKALAVLAKQDITIEVNRGFRTIAENRAVGGVPDSIHLVGRAIDINTNSNFKEIKDAMVGAGLSWGGEWKNKPERWHFCLGSNPDMAEVAACAREHPAGI